MANPKSDDGATTGTTANRTDAPSNRDQVFIFDTTLRDGEQCPGATMTHQEKLQVAEMLDAMGVDIIEAGFPIASNGDFEAVRDIAKLVKSATVAGLARATDKDIDRAGEAVREAVSPRIHTFISTSPVHMKYKLRMEPDAVLEAVTRSVTRARGFTDNVEWSAEDATRTEHEFLCRACETAIKAGATTINIPDTVGYTVPEEYFALFQLLREKVPGADKVIWSTHCHNDLGMAVANSLAGLKGGARQIECTINGIGERAGNAALEEIAMAINVRGDSLPYRHNITANNLARASKLVASVTAFPVQYNKAIVGKNAFAHESGIHQDGMLKHTQTYEIMTPESVGVKETTLVMGKHSGSNALRSKLKDMGYELDDDRFKDVFKRFKELADKKKTVFDEDIESLLDQGIAEQKQHIRFNGLEVFAGNKQALRAILTLVVDGIEVTKEASGDGPVDSIFNAIKEIVPHEAKLLLFQVMAVTHGTDAQAEVLVRLERDSQTYSGRGAETDTMVAAAKAYVSALNKLLLKRGHRNSVNTIGP